MGKTVHLAERGHTPPIVKSTFYHNLQCKSRLNNKIGATQQGIGSPAKRSGEVVHGEAVLAKLMGGGLALPNVERADRGGFGL